MDGLGLSLAAVLGLALGTAFGAVGAATNFCTLGAVSDAFLLRDDRRLRAWGLAIAAAVAASQGLELGAGTPLGRSVQRGPGLFWLGAVGGGLLFGIGMVLAGGCGFRLLLRAGAGSLRAVAALLVLALAAYATLHGVFARARLWLEGATAFDLRDAGFAGQGVAELFGPAAAAVAAVVLAGGLAAWAFSSGALRRDKATWLGGIGIGLLVGLGWLLTGHVGVDEFDPQPPRSISFVAPVGDTLAYVMTASGTVFGFAAAQVVGTALGAFLVAWTRGEFRREPVIQGSDFARHLLGGGLMGIGGVLAVGCTVGQGITGFSTLAITPFLVVPAIFVGAILTLRRLERSQCP